ncbi:hypothetical protein [Alkaliphilus transvaalensis]|uniref:hypothetical protein n=1 Tax=Alkaliphilus transvaalensis TaxID=114628 RepID=UPI00047AC267|nr:hypothetical protein [Alkaliphilus transvaalensis]
MKIEFSKGKSIICSFVAVIVTWFLNHELGLGPIVANGLVGVMAALFLSPPLAAVTYASSFVGMSSITVLPSLTAAAIGGIIIGGIWLLTSEIYAGIGGKGGTTAALATLITKAIMNIFS